MQVMEIIRWMMDRPPIADAERRRQVFSGPDTLADELYDPDQRVTEYLSRIRFPRRVHVIFANAHYVGRKAPYQGHPQLIINITYGRLYSVTVSSLSDK
jgi:hypothetical protein